MPYPVVRLNAQENYDQVARDKVMSARADQKRKERQEAKLQELSDAGLHHLYASKHLTSVSFAHHYAGRHA